MQWSRLLWPSVQTVSICSPTNNKHGPSGPLMNLQFAFRVKKLHHSAANTGHLLCSDSQHLFFALAHSWKTRRCTHTPRVPCDVLLISFMASQSFMCFSPCSCCDNRFVISGNSDRHTDGCACVCTVNVYVYAHSKQITAGVLWLKERAEIHHHDTHARTHTHTSRSHFTVCIIMKIYFLC